MEGRDPWLQRKVKESGAHKDMHKKKPFPKSLARKMKGVYFCRFFFLKPAGHKAGVLEVPRIG